MSSLLIRLGHGMQNEHQEQLNLEHNVGVPDIVHEQVSKYENSIEKIESGEEPIIIFEATLKRVEKRPQFFNW